MGERTQILLVSRRALLASAAAACALSACGQRAEPEGRVDAPVDPLAHDAFFLWAGVRPPEFLKRARTVYVLAGEVRHAGAPRFTPLRAVPRAQGPELWHTVRVERLDWDAGTQRAVLASMEKWERAGVRLCGLQIDFDAATRGLDGYAAFLDTVRRWLPPRWKLSITGLLDWSAGGDPAALERLGGIVDEVVIQTYQGRKTIPGYERYLASLRRLNLRYRIALVEGGDWREPEGLRADPDFAGYVVFLLSR